MNYSYKKDLDKNIFRGYDVRGIYPTNLDFWIRIWYSYSKYR